MGKISVGGLKGSRSIAKMSRRPLLFRLVQEQHQEEKPQGLAVSPVVQEELLPEAYLLAGDGAAVEAGAEASPTDRPAARIIGGRSTSGAGDNTGD